MKDSFLKKCTRCIYDFIDNLIDHKYIFSAVFSLLIVWLYEFRVLSGFSEISSDIIALASAVLTVESLVFALLTVIRNTELYKYLEENHEVNITTIYKNSSVCITSAVLEIILCVTVKLMNTIIKYEISKLLFGFFITFCFALMLITLYSSFKLSFDIFIYSNKHE